MAAAQPFPLLASAGNSRSASPALSSSSTAAAAGAAGAVAKVAGSDKSNACETKHRPAKPAQHKKSRHNKNSKQNELSNSNSNSNGGDGSDGKASTATATQTATTAFSDTNAATNNNTQATRKKSTKKRPTKQKNPATASTETSAVSGTAAGEAVETTAAATATATESSNSDGAPKKQSAKSGKKKGRGKSRQQRNAVAGSETGASSRASSSLSQSQATAPRSPAQYIKSSSGSTLSMAMIVPGENGRARVYFGPTANEDHQLEQQQQQQHAMHPGFHAGAPRFLASDVQQRRSSVGNFAPPRARFPVAQYGDGPMALGLGAPMMSAPQSASGAYFAPTSHLLANTRSVTSPSPAGYAYQPPSAHSAYNNAAPPSFRQRSMTSTQLRSTARSFLPQPHGSADYIHHAQTQLYSASAGQSRQPSYNAPVAMRRLSSATSVGVADHAGMHHPPLSAPALGALAGMRGRSQSVLTHSSTAGLRISMSQSRPGNVLAPQLPALSRTQSNGSATGQAGAFASGGYFASRRASVSSTGLAVDPNNTIRIPAIMFQKPGVEDQSAATSAPPTAAALATPTSAADEKAPADANAADQTRSETVAMRRLQDMIESMRKLGGTKPAGPRDRETAVPTPPLSATETAAASASEAGPGTATVSATASAAPSEAVPSAAADSGVAPSSAAPAAGASPTPSAHPTSRFDSILEEDEDSEDDEAKLDADAQSDSAANASESESSSPPPLAARSVTAGQSTATSAVCAL